MADALLIRGVVDFDDLANYRRFTDEIVSRKNAHYAKRIEAERPALQLLPGQRTCDHEETLVMVTSSGGFMGEAARPRSYQRGATKPTVSMLPR